MPRAPRKCPKEGCDNRITSTRYCEEHTDWHWSSENKRSYTHKVWAKAVLQRARYMCEIKGPGCLIRATIADHIVPVAEGGQHQLANGQGACQTCSDKKTQGEAVRGLHRRFGKPAQVEDPAPF